MNTDNIHWLGHDCFRIEDAGKQIYIDPWKLPENSLKSDYIFITHSHYDHLSKKDIEKIKKESTQLICPKDVAAELTGNIRIVEPNEEITVDQLEIKTIPAYNIGKHFHPKENNWIGFVLKLSDGTTIYHAGDTDFIPEMKLLKVDIALLPVSGTYVMTAHEAVKAAHTFKPNIVIPMHYGEIVGSVQDAKEFLKGFAGQTIIKKVEK